MVLTIILIVALAPFALLGVLVIGALIESAITDGHSYDPAAEARAEVIERRRLAAAKESALMTTVRRPGPVYSLPRDPAD